MEEITVVLIHMMPQHIELRLMQDPEILTSCCILHYNMSKQHCSTAFLGRFTMKDYNKSTKTIFRTNSNDCNNNSTNMAAGWSVPPNHLLGDAEGGRHC